MRKRMRKLAVLLVALAMMLQVSAAAVFYSDVSESNWYYKYVTTLSGLGVINGYADGSFQPAGTLKRGEFIKMLAESAELIQEGDTEAHWSAPYWRALRNAGVLQGVDIPCTREALNRQISRYEMAKLAANTIGKVFREEAVTVPAPSALVTDYDAVPETYAASVVQVYGKGIITGYEDGSFRGDKTLNRAEAAAVIYRLLFADERKEVEIPDVPAEDPKPTPDPDFQSFAFRYRTMSETDRRIALFGDPNKTYFASAEEAADYMTTVTVPVWRMGSAGKYSSTATLTVHKLVAREVELIFEEIYNDPEQYPVKYMGGARFSDTMRHAWGCAIDINYEENCYGYFDGDTFVPVTGSGWWPGENIYSIVPDGSVVRAFAKYGWGWGGQGYSGGWHDYMHFSILASGG